MTASRIASPYLKSPNFPVFGPFFQFFYYIRMKTLLNKSPLEMALFEGFFSKLF